MLNKLFQCLSRSPDGVSLVQADLISIIGSEGFKVLSSKKLFVSGGDLTGGPCDNCGQHEVEYLYDDGKVSALCSPEGVYFKVATDSVKSWRFDYKELGLLLGNGWALEGASKEIVTSDLWFLGRKSGVALLFCREVSDEILGKISEYSSKIVIHPCALEANQRASFHKVFLDEFLELKNDDLILSPIDGEMTSVIPFVAVDNEDSILLDAHQNLRFHRSAKTLSSLKEGEPNSQTEKLNLRALELLYFLYSQARSNSRQEFFSLDDVREKSPYFKEKGMKNLQNAVSELLGMSEDFLGVNSLLERDKSNSRISLNSNLTCVFEMRLKRSQESSQ